MYVSSLCAEATDTNKFKREWTDVVYANALDETDIENGYVG
jgi:hypothetical protein